MVKSWILNVDNQLSEFDNFDNAVQALKDIIRKYYKDNDDAFDREGMPFAAGAFFNHKFDNGDISDEEIVVNTRLSMLCNAFLWTTKDESKDATIRAVKKNISYSSDIKEFEERLYVNIDVKPEEVTLDVTHIDLIPDEKTYLRSNAFIFANEEKKYYFHSHQIISTSSKEELLGKVVDLDITLERK